MKNREFWVSTGVDLAVSFVVGLAAAAIVASVITLFATTAPVWAAVAATAAVGMEIGWVLEYFDISNKAKNWLNS